MLAALTSLNTILHGVKRRSLLLTIAIVQSRGVRHGIQGQMRELLVLSHGSKGEDPSFTVPSNRPGRSRVSASCSACRREPEITGPVCTRATNSSDLCSLPASPQGLCMLEGLQV